MQTITSFTLNLPTQPEREENGMKVGNNVTSDPAIRKALNIGINRAEIIKNALDGFGEPTYMYSKELAWVNPEFKHHRQSCRRSEKKFLKMLDGKTQMVMEFVKKMA